MHASHKNISKVQKILNSEPNDNPSLSEIIANFAKVQMFRHWVEQVTVGRVDQFLHNSKLYKIGCKIFAKGKQ